MTFSIKCKGNNSITVKKEFIKVGWVLVSQSVQRQTPQKKKRERLSKITSDFFFLTKMQPQKKREKRT